MTDHIWKTNQPRPAVNYSQHNRHPHSVRMWMCTLCGSMVPVDSFYEFVPPEILEQQKISLDCNTALAAKIHSS